ncbi:hypothetical protein Tco_0811322 [Tanacetum coccineum]
MDSPIYSNHHQLPILQYPHEKGENAPIVTKTVDGKVRTVIPPNKCVRKKAQRRTELKARITLFGGNTATKKTQKNLLKQQYENFAASSTEVIEQTYERLQKLISQLEMQCENMLRSNKQKRSTTFARHAYSSNKFNFFYNSETNEPETSRKENGAIIIEDYVSDVNPQQDLKDKGVIDNRCSRGTVKQSGDKYIGKDNNTANQLCSRSYHSLHSKRILLILDSNYRRRKEKKDAKIQE